jgi:C4-dicarboxylate-specific signal transduction histidine kinase
MHPLGSVNEVNDRDKVGIHAPVEAFQTSGMRSPQSGNQVRRCGTIASSIVPLLSHDIRNHLTAVLCNAELMSEPMARATDRKQLFEEVKLAIKHMTDLLDVMLHNARNDLPPQETLESFNNLIERTIRFVRLHPHAKGVRISIDESPPIEAMFDTTIVSSAVYNLLLNACFAAQRGGEPGNVEVALREDSESVHILVTDNGPGVPASLERCLFEPFVTSGKPGGVGLGINIAESVARGYGGCLRLKSSRPGCTVFDLELAKALLPVLQYASLAS